MCLNCHFRSMKWLIIVIRLFLLLSRSQSKDYHPVWNCINFLLCQVSCSRTQHDEPGCGLELGPLLVYLEPSALTTMTLLIISKAMHKHLNCQLITPVSYVMFQLSVFSDHFLLLWWICLTFDWQYERDQITIYHKVLCIDDLTRFCHETIAGTYTPGPSQVQA